MRRVLQRWRELTAIERMLLRRAVAASIVARIALVIIPWKRLVEGRPGTLLRREPFSPAVSCGGEGADRRMRGRFTRTSFPHEQSGNRAGDAFNRSRTSVGKSGMSRMRPPHPPSAPFDSLRSLRAGSSPPARNRGGRRTLDETESRGVQADCDHCALAEPEAIALVRWAVGVSARRVPFQTCLSSALVARDLLARLGVQSTLEVGAYLDEHGALAFHAAVISGGVMICGERPMTVLASIATS